MLSVGVPVGLGIYCAWVHGDWSGKTKDHGIRVAAGGALARAWLGFNAAEDLLALITAIAGAAVGGNQPLLGLDIFRDRQARDRFAVTEANETL